MAVALVLKYFYFCIPGGTLTETINPTLKVLQAQSFLVKPAAAFSDPTAVSKTGR
jgi:hypothetical protein